MGKAPNPLKTSLGFLLGVTPHDRRRDGAKPLQDKDLRFEGFSPHPLDTTRGCVYNVPMNENDQTLDLGELPSCDECGGEKVWDPNGHMSHCTVCGHVEIL